MENFENLSAFDYIPDLPNELLNLSPCVQVFSPIHSPDTLGTQSGDVQAPEIPISSNQLESHIEDKSPPADSIQPFQSLDINSSQPRPKRAAAVAANFWISSLKRKGTFDDSDKENEFYVKPRSKINMSKKRKSTLKKKSSPLNETHPENSENQISSSQDETQIEKRLDEYSLNEQIQTINTNLVDIPIEFIQNNQINEELPNQENEILNPNILCSNLYDPLLLNAINPPGDTELDATTSLNTPTRIDKSMVFCLSDNLYYDDSNYEKDDLGFTISRAVEPNFEQHDTHFEFNLDMLHQPFIDLNNNYLSNDIQNSEDPNKSESPRTETMFYEGIDLLKLSHGKRTDKLIGYAASVIKVLFSANEIKRGIFPDNEGKTRSKCRMPFDSYRTEILKEAIIKKFNYNPLSLEKLWTNIRPLINKCLYNLRKSV